MQNLFSFLQFLNTFHNVDIHYLLRKISKNLIPVTFKLFAGNMVNINNYCIDLIADAIKLYIL